MPSPFTQFENQSFSMQKQSLGWLFLASDFEMVLCKAKHPELHELQKMTPEHGSKNCWYALAAPNISLLLAEKTCTGYENEVLAWGICSCCRLGVSCLWAVVWGKVAGMLCRRLPGTLGNLSDGWRRKFSSCCLSVAGRADAGGVNNCFLQDCLVMDTICMWRENKV